MADIYNPTLTSILAWVSARYTCVLLGWEHHRRLCSPSPAFTCAIFAINALSPVLAGNSM
jgi:APA family basic amino acid/polyamine antiporter